MLLNPDVGLYHRYLEELVRVMDSVLGVGVVGGKPLLGDSQRDGDAVGKVARPLDSTAHFVSW